MRLPYEFARAEQVLLQDGQVRFTSSSQVSAIAEAQRVAQAYVSFQKVSASVFAQELEQLYRDSSTEAAGAAEKASDAESLEALADSAAAVDDLLGQREDAPVVRLINALLLEAIRARASDVHIELEETQLVVRFRVDGELRQALTANRALAPQLVSRIKVMGRLDIAEKRLPQDGRVSLRVDSYHLDARISTIPSQYGERVVLRLLDRGNAHIGVGGLGMPDDMSQRFEGLLKRPDGLILVTGPTGSGKTTTLYAGLGALDCRNLNVMTIEDPIEYALPGISQMQVNPATDLTFARGLRALLRQDPNVIMVGEIRDTETARIAVEAATTGHLVMSTLHTNTAIGSVARLLDLGVERFLLAPVLRGLMAQRLVRKTCSHCVQTRKATEAERALLQGRLSEGDAVHEGMGCEACGQTGFHGRIALYDLIEVGPHMEEAIASGASERALFQMTKGAASGLLADGAQKVREGLTTPREVARVFTELDEPPA